MNRPRLAVLHRRLTPALAFALVLLGTVAAAPAEAGPRRDRGLIVYVSDRDSTSADAVVDEVYGLDPRTGAVTRLTYDLPGIERWPTVSPDGRSLAWVRWVVDADGVPRQDQAALYRCDLRVRHGRVVCLRSREVTGPVAESRIAWTPDSRSLVYAGQPTADFDTDLYRVRVRTGQVRNLTAEPADGVAVSNLWPTVSPDGRELVHTRGTGGPTLGDLYRRPLDGGAPEQLTAAPLNDIAPDYSPDGRRLVFHSNRDGDADIYVMRAEPEGPDNPAVDLTDGLRSADGTVASQERIPSFSPDGRSIAFWWFTQPAGGPLAGFDDGEIWTMRSDGSRPRNLTDNNPTDPQALTVGDIQPDWGPDVRGPRR